MLTPTLAGINIAEDGGWSLWRQFTFNLTHFEISTKNGLE